MNELKDLFDTVLAEPGRDRLDIDAAVRRGRRRRWTRTGAVLASTAVAVGLAAALVVSALPRSATPVATPATSSAVSQPSPTAGGSSLVQSPPEIVGMWSLTELDGRSVEDLLRSATKGTFDPIILGVTFAQAADGTWSWTSHDYCNEIRGTFTVDSGRFAAVRTESTRWKCPHNAQIAQADAGRPSIEALTEADEARYVGDEATGIDNLLLLRDGIVIARYVGPAEQRWAKDYLAGAPKLVSAPQHHTEPVGDPAELVGRWLAVEVGGHDVTGRAERNRRVEFAKDPDGSYAWSGADGCNGWAGTYWVTGGRFRVPTRGASTFVACSQVDVPATATIRALTIADQVRFAYDLQPGTDPQPTEFVLLQDGRVLARFVQVS